MSFEALPEGRCRKQEGLLLGPGVAEIRVREVDLLRRKLQFFGAAKFSRHSAVLERSVGDDAPLKLKEEGLIRNYSTHLT